MKFERIGKSVWRKKANSNNKESMVRYCTMYMHTLGMCDGNGSGCKEMSRAELSKLEFLIKFHQFDNRRKFIVVVANNVKRRCHCRRRHCRRWPCRLKNNILNSIVCTQTPPPSSVLCLPFSS